MTQAQQEKLARFMQDEVMAHALYSHLMDSFLKKRERNSVEELAASRIALDIFLEAWERLNQYKLQERNGGKPLIQVGM